MHQHNGWANINGRFYYQAEGVHEGRHRDLQMYFNRTGSPIVVVRELGTYGSMKSVYCGNDVEAALQQASFVSRQDLEIPAEL